MILGYKIKIYTIKQFLLFIYFYLFNFSYILHFIKHKRDLGKSFNLSRQTGKEFTIQVAN